ncbi:YlbF family regulator [Salipaludibacillus sp. CUR1]|uniref:YlbF family regulator n=1 Tax=Salipaludibacillus sp. CUR1 TaxID=2820003 RepID=UPI001E43960B|nr:YlbF family regulator [Salipaludibacillus sp. CUR1]MCE7794726.1 YlbF family regulator [Salipaludibacillus sp. CUR1]
MVTTMTDINILQETSQFSDLIISSDIFYKYTQTKKEVQTNAEAQEMLVHFQGLKEKYEEVQRFGKYHPDFHKVTSEVREYKRKIDTHPLISEYKTAEKELESLLTEVSRILAHSVSQEIKVPTGNPFFDQAGCSGGCGSGGSCGCG